VDTCFNEVLFHIATAVLGIHGSAQPLAAGFGARLGGFRKFSSKDPSKDQRCDNLSKGILDERHDHDVAIKVSPSLQDISL
jgi:hypothetical protein